jgi:hypothetical protein
MPSPTKPNVTQLPGRASGRAASEHPLLLELDAVAVVDASSVVVEVVVEVSVLVGPVVPASDGTVVPVSPEVVFVPVSSTVVLLSVVPVLASAVPASVAPASGGSVMEQLTVSHVAPCATHLQSVVKVHQLLLFPSLAETHEGGVVL